MSKTLWKAAAAGSLLFVDVVVLILPPPGSLAPARRGIVRAPEQTRHNFQGSVGLGYRF